MSDHAKDLRRAQTDAERALWARLRDHQLGVKFRRQHRVDGYILDFACRERGLAIDLDSSQHFDQASYDQRRTTALENLGLRVIRFWNHDVLLRTDDVLQAIVAALNEPMPPHPNPLSRLRQGRGGNSVHATNEPTPARSNPPPDSGRGRGGNSVRATNEPSPSPPTALVSGERAGVRGQKLGVRGPKSQPAQSAATDPGALRGALQLRAQLYGMLRQFFCARQVLEVETPVLSQAGNTEPNINGFATTFTGPITAGSRERFLRTSAEYPMKRLLAAGMGDCYELGRVFRNGEAGRNHNPEFTMLEWYRLGMDHHAIAVECAELVGQALALVGRTAPVTRTSYRDWFLAQLGIDPFAADVASLRAPLRAFNIAAEGLTRDDWLDLLITHCLQPALPPDGLTIVHDFPAAQCSLARIRPGDPPLAARFELYLGRRELANGYHELNDGAEQRARFENENRRRCARGLRELPLDENLLAVLDRLPACAGVALGIERLLMHMLGCDDIRELLAFAFAEA